MNQYFELFLKVFSVTLGGGLACLILLALLIWLARMGAEKEAEAREEPPTHRSDYPVKWKADDV